MNLWQFVMVSLKKNRQAVSGMLLVAFGTRKNFQDLSGEHLSSRNNGNIAVVLDNMKLASFYVISKKKNFICTFICNTVQLARTKRF